MSFKPIQRLWCSSTMIIAWFWAFRANYNTLTSTMIDITYLQRCGTHVADIAYQWRCNNFRFNRSINILDGLVSFIFNTFKVQIGIYLNYLRTGWFIDCICYREQHFRWLKRISIEAKRFRNMPKKWIFIAQFVYIILIIAHCFMSAYRHASICSCSIAFVSSWLTIITSK